MGGCSPVGRKERPLPCSTCLPAALLPACLLGCLGAPAEPSPVAVLRLLFPLPTLQRKLLGASFLRNTDRTDGNARSSRSHAIFVTQASACLYCTVLPAIMPSCRHAP